MAKVLKKKGIKPDLILSSSAVRAYEFAKIIAEEFGIKKKKLISAKDLYMADENELLNIVREVNDDNETVFLVGHNPDLTNFANSLCNYNLDNIPTSGIFCVEFDIGKWKDTDYGKGKFKSFDYPKKFYN